MLSYEKAISYQLSRRIYRKSGLRSFKAEGCPVTAYIKNGSSEIFMD